MDKQLSKDKIIELLKKKNLSVKLENGVVMLTYDFEHKEEQIEKFCSLLEELDYHCSFGYRGKTSMDKQNFEEMKENNRENG